MSPPATSGERDKLVMIEQRPSADDVDDGGFPSDAPWTDLGQVWMRKRDVHGLGERFVAEQISASFDTEWELLYRSDMDPEAIDLQKTRRLLYRARYYDIVHAALRPRPEGQAIVLRTLAGSKV